MGILPRDGAILDDVRHAGEGLPEVAAVGTALEQRRHRGVEVFQVGSELGSVHAASIGRGVSLLEIAERRLCRMDEAAPLSLFEQLQHRVADAAEPLEVLQQFEAELLARYPADAAEVVELITSWDHRLGVLTNGDLEGFI